MEKQNKIKQSTCETTKQFPDLYLKKVKILTRGDGSPSNRRQGGRFIEVGIRWQEGILQKRGLTRSRQLLRRGKDFRGERDEDRS